MTTKRIVYTRAEDGGVSIVHPAAGGRLSLVREVKGQAEPIIEQEPEDAWLARLIKSDVPADATNVHIVEAADIPPDRSFRNAWRHDAGVISVDMPKAREVHKAHIRKARQAALTALDVAYQRADETGDAAGKAQIAKRKQALRDLTAHPGIAKAATPQDLQAVWHEDLPR